MTQMNYAEAVRLIKLGRRAEKRGAAAKGCITALVITAGFWWATLISFLLRGALAATAPPKAKS